MLIHFACMSYRIDRIIKLKPQSKFYNKPIDFLRKKFLQNKNRKKLNIII
jgi:hypothetical protein